MTPEPYYDAVGWTLPDALDVLRPLVLTPEPRPAEYCLRETARFRAEADDGFVDAAGAVNLKFCRVQSAKVDVALVMVYPTARPDLVPAFSAEWVVFGDRGHLLVIDAHPAGPAPGLDADLAAVLAPLADIWQPAFPADRPAPDWFRALARSWAVFTAAPADRLGDVRAAYWAYLQAAADHFYAPRQIEAGGGVDAAAVAEYKAKLFAHTPGRRLMTTAFGAGYAEPFLAWHFGPPGEPHCQPPAGLLH